MCMYDMLDSCPLLAVAKATGRASLCKGPHFSGCQNYGPFLGPRYSTTTSI